MAGGKHACQRSLGLRVRQDGAKDQASCGNGEEVLELMHHRCVRANF